MPKRAALPDYCAIARSLEVIGERWTMLIVRDAFFGVRNFDDFQANLGIARNVLASRLAMLVEQGVLTRRPNPDDGRRIEYRLTDKGRALFPLVVGLGEWGRQWATEAGAPLPFDIVDRDTGRPIAGVAVLSADGRPLTSRDTALVAGPGMTDAIRRTLPALRRPQPDREGRR